MSRLPTARRARVGVGRSKLVGANEAKASLRNMPLTSRVALVVVERGSVVRRKSNKEQRWLNRVTVLMPLGEFTRSSRVR